jgi:hypothetical protein
MSMLGGGDRGAETVASARSTREVTPRPAMRWTRPDTAQRSFAGAKDGLGQPSFGFRSPVSPPHDARLTSFVAFTEHDNGILRAQGKKSSETYAARRGYADRRPIFVAGFIVWESWPRGLSRWTIMATRPIGDDGLSRYNERMPAPAFWFSLTIARRSPVFSRFSRCKGRRRDQSA